MATLRRRSGALKAPAAFTVLAGGVLRAKIARLPAATVGAGAGLTSEDLLRPAAGGDPRRVLGLSAGYFTVNVSHSVAAAACASVAGIVACMR